MKPFHALTFLAVPALFAAVPSAATMPGSGPDSEAAKGGAGDKDPNKLVCKREKVAGSRLTAKKVCMTAAEWERQRREDQQMAEKVQSARWKAD